MNINELERLTTHLYDMATADPDSRRYLATLIWGESGIGKTQTVNHAAELLSDKLGEEVQTTVLMLGQLDVGDLIGLPREQEVYPDPIAASTGTGATKLYPKRSLVAHLRAAYPEQFGDMGAAEVFERAVRAGESVCPHFMGETRTVYALPEWFPEQGTRGILFLDEINRSHTEIRQAIFQLLLDRTMHGVKLPSDWIVVAAANPPTEDYEVELMYDKAFMARFLHIGLKPTHDEWLSYAAKRNLETSIRSLIAGAPAFLGNLNIIIPDVSPTPRSWELLSKILPGLPNDLTLEVAQGIVGNEAAFAWEKIKKSPDKPLTGDDILNGYGSGRVDGLNLTHWLGGHIASLGEAYKIKKEDGTDDVMVPATNPTESRARMGVFFKAQRNDLIMGTMHNLEERLRQREEAVKPGQHPMTNAEALRVVQFFQDLVDANYRDLAYNFAKVKLPSLTGPSSTAGAVSNQLTDSPGFGNAVIQMVSASGIMDQAEIDSFSDELPDEFFDYNVDDDDDDDFGGLDEGYDPALLDRLLPLVA